MTPHLAVLAVVASALAVSGCSAPAAVPLGPSDAEVDELIAQELDVRWQSYGFPPDRPRPEVARIAFTTLDTWTTTQVTCLRDAGLDASEVSGGFVVSGTEPADYDSREAMWVCQAQYPRDPRGSGFLSIAQILYMYDFYTTRLRPCMQLLGYTVTQPPDRLAYVGLLRSGSYWSPYFGEGNEPQQIDADKWRLVDAECSHLPKDPYWPYHPLSRLDVEQK
jgi:hypothetical protein